MQERNNIKDIIRIPAAPKMNELINFNTIKTLQDPEDKLEDPLAPIHEDSDNQDNHDEEVA